MKGKSNPVREEWKRLDKPGRIRMLVKDFGMTKKEAHEIYVPRWRELPREVRDEMK